MDFDYSQEENCLPVEKSVRGDVKGFIDVMTYEEVVQAGV